MKFPELLFLEDLIENMVPEGRVRLLARIQHGQETFPIHGISFGTEAPEAPCLALVGGVHGQEKIGSQVVLSYLETLMQLLRWDETTQNLLQKIRICFLPIANPVGMFLHRRGNGNRVDLMRNSPLDAIDSTIPFLGGQRLTPFLPWYRGRKQDPMEVEAQVICEFIRAESFFSKTTIALDCHSGYGNVDRIWFPFSRTLKPFPNLPEAYALKKLLDITYPNHVYRMEPGAQGYTIGGDLWDFLYEEHQILYQGKKLFLPLTLEMGSWTWLKKNPIQLFSALGFFHPLQHHRHKRILRRHITFLDFLVKATNCPDAWSGLSQEERLDWQKQALEYWYEQ